MKNLLSLLTTLSCIAPAVASDSLERIEVPVNKVFVPTQGFDDNDTVEVVIDGALPNSCYSLADQSVEVNPHTHTLNVRQYAYRKKDGICSQGTENLPVDAQMLIPFQEDVLVGQLDKGTYKVEYKAPPGTKERSFLIEKAPTTSVDNIRYAAVNNVYVPDLVHPGEDISARISGILNSSCTQLGSNIRVEKVDDVIIVLPPVEITYSGPCLQVIRPFNTQLDLGPIQQQGRYMVHVRSMNGRAVNHVFSVEK